ncbi:MAG: DNA translocase FtsK [Breznakia sp.]
MAKKNKKRQTRKKTTRPIKGDRAVTFLIYNLIGITVAIIGALNVGVVGIFLHRCVRFVFGEMSIFVFLMMMFICMYLAIKKNFESLWNRYSISLFVVLFVCLSFLTSMNGQDLKGMDIFDFYINNARSYFLDMYDAHGGLLGALLYGSLSTLFGKVGTYVVLICVLLIVLLILLTPNGRSRLKAMLIAPFYWIKEKTKREDTTNIEDDSVMEPLDYDPQQDPLEDYADLLYDDNGRQPSLHKQEESSFGLRADAVMKKDATPFVEKKVGHESNLKDIQEVEKSKHIPYVSELLHYTLPKLSLFEAKQRSGKKSSNTSAANDAGKKLVHILEQFGVQAKLVATHIGPSVTKFELRPDMGVRVNRISNLQQDIKMGLAAKEIRIEAPIPGKSTVGIEIPNVEMSLVGIRDLLRQIPDTVANKKLLFALGKDLMGNCVYADMEKLTHLLIAGATGSGKSVCVNAIVTSIIMRARPDEVKILLIDPKKVEFTQFANIPHLIAPVITNAEEASRALEVVVKMMDERYDIFSKIGVRNLSSYNELVERNQNDMKKLPKIIVIIDELADLMLVAAKDVEARIQRITQLARAAGIHLIVATQRPSVDVITGLIKANIPSRIAFAVSSAIDSRTILDQQGAEKLLGNGDMLYIPRGENSPIRVQGCYVSDKEVDRVAKCCASQAKPQFEDVFVNLAQVDAIMGDKEVNDILYEDVRLFVIESGKASTSFIQRKFSIGYARAARLIDHLEAKGVIGPANGSKPRDVYVKKEQAKEIE